MPHELAGFTIGVTADSQRDELATLLRRRGARVVIAPALRIVPLTDDTELREATRACLSRPPDVLVANTGIGMRGWLEAAEGWGLSEPLRGVLSRAYVVTRGPEARGAIRAAGLRDRWSPGAESCEEVVEHLVRRGVAGQVVVVQLHGDRQPEYAAALEEAGATVIEVPVYRWAPPTDPAPLHRLIDLVAGRLVDAVTFTSAPAAEALLHAAGDRTETVLEALRGDVLASCVGAVAAEPLVRRGVPVSAPSRARLGALVRTIVDELPRRTVTIRADGHLLTLRGHAAVIDEELRPLAPAPMAVLRALATSPGRVLSRTALLRTLPRGADEHAVEMAVARLRAGLRAPRVVQTVIKRGYRLRVD
ncbi:uroporphyrinogen-III synthase [Micromonospora rubida]|uniref:uroporphyrinogen-III synthase n=1 Tax=Micromonospora rubida TaxID=2697657 RepID=UPI001378EBAC|nr:uroporphyrinogen-III synthase [Micromonospora rubida]NBE80790.1 uroporphyrinogen-III synthase [Micromonospora rubida]